MTAPDDDKPAPPPLIAAAVAAATPGTSMVARAVGAMTPIAWNVHFCTAQEVQNWRERRLAQPDAGASVPSVGAIDE